MLDDPLRYRIGRVIDIHQPRRGACSCGWDDTSQFHIAHLEDVILTEIVNWLRHQAEPKSQKPSTTHDHMINGLHWAINMIAAEITNHHPFLQKPNVNVLVCVCGRWPDHPVHERSSPADPAHSEKPTVEATRTQCACVFCLMCVARGVPR